jgi:hypothetical protein
MCKKLIFLIPFVFVMVLSIPAQGGIINRYSFTDGDTVVIDSVNGRDGTLEGTASIAGNKLVLDGGGAAYLPGDVLDLGLTSVTIEVWFDITTDRTWQRLFDFGDSRGGSGGEGFFYTPNAGGDYARFAVNTESLPSYSAPGEDTVQTDEIAVGTPTHVVCVLEGGTEIRLYHDGVLVDSRPTTFGLSTMSRNRAYIGDALYTGDPYMMGSVDEFRIYGTALTDGEVLDSFNAGPDAAIVIVEATKPEPKSGASDLPRWAMLSWESGAYGDTHDVYFGTSLEDVTSGDASVLVSEGQADTFYDATGLDYGTTYYWRIDEVNAVDMTVYPGRVWRLSTKPIGLIIPEAAITATASSQQADNQGPENTIDSSGLNENNQHSTAGLDMWFSDATVEPNKAWVQYDFDKLYKMPQMLIWNYNAAGFLSGAGIKDVTIEYSSDGGENWTTLDSVTELPQGPGTDDYSPLAVDLGGVADGLTINSIRITANSNWSNGIFNLYGLSEVRFYYVDVWPKEPVPADGATDVDFITTLGWTPGEGVVEHIVYLDTDEQAVIDGLAPSVTVADPSLDVELLLDTTYFWRVEEVNMEADPNIWSGDTWSFTTTDHLVVDDFESYDDSISNWSGGSSSSGNGAAIGPVETSIVRSGDQSMQLLFDNTSTEGYSEISVNPSNLDSGKNWTQGGANYLVFWIYGDLDNVDTEYLYVKLNDATYKRLVPNSRIVTPWWTQVTIPLNPLNLNLNSVSNLSIGFMRDDVDTGTGEVYIDDIRLYRTPPVGPTDEIYIEAESADSITLPYQIIDDDPNTNAYGGAYIETTPGSGRAGSPDPNGTATYTINVAGGVYSMYIRVSTIGNNDAAWFIIDDGNNIGDINVHNSGRLENETWARFNGIPARSGLQWIRVRSDSSSEPLLFNLTPGTHTLRIARREEDTKIDAIIITD